MFTENTEELAQNKLLLLFIINKSKNLSPMKKLLNSYWKIIIWIILIQQYLSELVESNFIKQIDKEGKKYIYY